MIHFPCFFNSISRWVRRACVVCALVPWGYWQHPLFEYYVDGCNDCGLEVPGFDICWQVCHPARGVFPFI